MRHQPEHIPLATADARDIVTRPVWVRGVSDASIRFTITKYDSIFALKFCECTVVADVVTFGVCDRNPQHRPFLQLICIRTVGRLHADVYMLTNEVQIAIAD